MIKKVSIFLFLASSLILNAGNVIITVKDADIGGFLNGAKVTLRGAKLSYEAYSDDGDASLYNLDSGKYNLTVVFEGYATKSADLTFDFAKKDTFAGSVSLVRDYSSGVIDEREEQAELEPQKIFKKDKEMIKLLKADDELAKKVKSGKTPREELGLLRAEIAAGMLERALKENNGQYYKLSWQYAKSAVGLARSLPYPWFVYGFVNLQNSRSPEAQFFAEDAFEKCLELEPANPKAKIYLAESLYNQDLFAPSADILETILSDSLKTPDPRLLSMLNLCYMRDDMPERGEAFFIKLSHKYPDSAQVKIQLAVLYHEQGKKKDALAELDRVIKNNKTSKEEKEYAQKLLLWNKEQQK